MTYFLGGVDFFSFEELYAVLLHSKPQSQANYRLQTTLRSQMPLSKLITLSFHALLAVIALVSEAGSGSMIMRAINVAINPNRKCFMLFILL